MHCARILKGKYRNEGIGRAGKILTELQLWGGAYVVDPTKKHVDPEKKHAERMRAAFHLSVVNGRVCNLYSKVDKVLLYL